MINLDFSFGFSVCFYNGLWTESLGPKVVGCVLQTSDFGLSLSIQGQKVISKGMMTH